MRNAAIAALLLLLSLLSWGVFPGHTWLQQDTQIYNPILEHLRDPTVLQKDIVVQRPHVAYTLYDESALILRAVAGLDFRTVLLAEQILARTLGLWGVYLIATSLGVEIAPALLAALIWSLGATVGGPAVLTVEYEPVPRGFAVPHLMLAVGLAAHRRWIWSGVATGAAALLHPPTLWPILGIYAVLIGKKESRWALAPFAAAALLLLTAAKLQPGVTEHQQFMSTIPPHLEMLQRMRAPYNWLDMWGRDYLSQYLFLAVLCAAAIWRLWPRMSPGLRPFAIGLPLAGLVSMPLSYLLLNVWKWSLAPQVQLMRALLFVPAMASVLSASAGGLAARRRRPLEAFLWFLTPWILPIQTHLFWNPTKEQWAVWIGFSILSVFLCTVPGRAWLAIGAYWLMALVVSFPPRLRTAELEALSRWAKLSAPRDAVFLFADSGKANDPGVFRSEALRAVYADWKGGGQLNYLPEFADEWWRRWEAMQPADAAHYETLGVDYVVRSAGRELGGKPRVFENGRYWVYRLR